MTESVVAAMIVVGFPSFVVSAFSSFWLLLSVHGLREFFFKLCGVAAVMLLYALPFTNPSLFETLMCGWR